MKVWIQGQRAVTLTKRHYLAQGGQGTIYTQRGVAYKIYHNPADVLSPGKLNELSRIVEPSVIKPLDYLHNKSGVPVGYSMRHVKNCVTLCQIVPRAFRERVGLEHNQIATLVQELRRGLAEIHRSRVVVVDLNEFNVLVSSAFDRVYFIDVDSYQTPSFRARAIMDSVRDRHAPDGEFSQQTDWFSFAIVTFQMFVGIHPFKGKHPSIVGLDSRMKANVSVFDSQVRVPKVAYPLEVIPHRLRAWYEAVFQRGERTPPPSEHGVAVSVPSREEQSLASRAVRVCTLLECDERVRNVWAHNGSLVAATDRALWIDGRRVACPQGVRAVGFCARSNRPVAVLAANTFFDVVAGVLIAGSLGDGEVVTADGRIYCHVDDRVNELVLREAGDSIVVSLRLAANVLPHATRLYAGVAMQTMLGATVATLFPDAGHTYQCRLPELDDYTVVEAGYGRGVLMVVGRPRGKMRGDYDRFVFRFDDTFQRYDVRCVSGVPFLGLNFAVLDSDICVAMAEDESLELFYRYGPTGTKTVRDSSLGGDMILRAHAERLIAIRGRRVYQLSIR